VKFKIKEGNARKPYGYKAREWRPEKGQKFGNQAAKIVVKRVGELATQDRLYWGESKREVYVQDRLVSKGKRDMQAVANLEAKGGGRSERREANTTTKQVARGEGISLVTE